MSAGRNVNSQSQDWCTPLKYVKAIVEMFDGNIELDPCSNKYSIVNAKTEFMLPSDGLSKLWNYRTIYVNPPYGADRVRKTTIKDWIKKSYESYIEFGSEILLLVPVATNTSHWKNYIFGKAVSICFLYDTRLKFIINGNDNNKGTREAPFQTIEKAVKQAREWRRLHNPEAKILYLFFHLTCDRSLYYLNNKILVYN